MYDFLENPEETFYAYFTSSLSQFPISEDHYFIRIPQLAAGMETSSRTVVKLHYFKSTGANISSTFNGMRHHNFDFPHSLALT